MTIGVNNTMVGQVTLGPKEDSPVPVPGSVTLATGVSAMRLTMPDPPHECIRLYSISVVAH